MQAKIQELIKEISSLKRQEIFLVAIDGCGGSGKSTFAKKLALELGNSQVIHIDDFYKPKEQRVEITKQTPVHSNFEFDRLKQQVLERLKHGTTATYQTPSGEKVKIKPNGYVIVEGLGTLGAELKNYFDYKIWIDAPETLRRQRGIKRDSVAWTKIWDDEYLPQDARYVSDQTPHNEADWILHNS